MPCGVNSNCFQERKDQPFWCSVLSVTCFQCTQMCRCNCLQLRFLPTAQQRGVLITKPTSNYQIPLISRSQTSPFVATEIRTAKGQGLISGNFNLIGWPNSSPVLQAVCCSAVPHHAIESGALAADPASATQIPQRIPREYKLNYRGLCFESDA